MHEHEVLVLFLKHPELLKRKTEGRD